MSESRHHQHRPIRQSGLLRVRASGPLACFTRPELKVERVSYEVMTPSAARGILESILWKPAIAWYVSEIAVLRPIKWVSFRRNEVKSRLNPARSRDYYADDDRTQRNTVALRDRSGTTTTYSNEDFLALAGKWNEFDF